MNIRLKNITLSIIKISAEMSSRNTVNNLMLFPWLGLVLSDGEKD